MLVILSVPLLLTFMYGYGLDVFRHGLEKEKNTSFKFEKKVFY